MSEEAVTTSCVRLVLNPLFLAPQAPSERDPRRVGASILCVIGDRLDGPGGLLLLEEVGALKNEALRSRNGLELQDRYS